MGKQSRARRLQKDLPSARPGAQAAPLPPLILLPSTERLALGLILFLGLLLRLAYLLEYRARSVYYGQLMLDAQVYENWARRIAGGEWLGGGVFYHAPLYPYLIALFFKVLGDRYLPISFWRTGSAGAAHPAGLGLRPQRFCSSTRRFPSSRPRS